MLDSILNLIKTTVSKEITGDMVPKEKQQQTVDTTAHALVDGLQQNLSAGNIGHLLDMVKGQTDSAHNPVAGKLQNHVVNSLMQKVGLSQSSASGIATMVIPAVMKMLAGKTKEMNGKGFDVESLLHSLRGNEGDHTNLLQNIGKMFGK